MRRTTAWASFTEYRFSLHMIPIIIPVFMLFMFLVVVAPVYADFVSLQPNVSYLLRYDVSNGLGEVDQDWIDRDFYVLNNDGNWASSNEPGHKVLYEFNLEPYNQINAIVFQFDWQEGDQNNISPYFARISAYEPNNFTPEPEDWVYSPLANWARDLSGENTYSITFPISGDRGALGFAIHTREIGIGDRWGRLRNPQLEVSYVSLNQPPVADAGEDQFVYLGGGEVTLDGTGSYDPDDDPIWWLWAFDSVPPGSVAMLDSQYSPTPRFLPDLVGDYVLSLVVNDGLADSLPDTVTISVAENQPPTAVALADVIEGPVPLTVVLDGSQSYDPEGGSLYHLWSFGDGSVPVEADVTTHVYDHVGTYGTSLTVVDDFGLSDTDTLIITVLPQANNPPTASPTAVPNAGSSPLVVHFHANASDLDGDDLTYVWDFGDPASSDNASTLPDPQHVYESPGTYVVWLTVSDGQDEVSASLTIVVGPAIEMSVRRAFIHWRGPCSSIGKVSLTADFSAEIPDPDDLVAVYIDGITLFDAPFSQFRQSPFNDNVYVLVKKRRFARLDFDNMHLIVHRRKVNLSSLDNANGVDVELYIGDTVAVENIVMESVSGRRLRYVRPDLVVLK